MLMGSSYWLDGGKQVPDAALSVAFTRDEPWSFNLEIAQNNRLPLPPEENKDWGNTTITLGIFGKLL